MAAEPNYPGEGSPWADFLHHRMRVLAQWRDEGMGPAESAARMSMDPTQVTLILMTWDGYLREVAHDGR